MSELRFVIDDAAKFRDVVLRLEQLIHDVQELRAYMTEEVTELKRVAAKTSDTMEAAASTLRGLSAILVANADNPAAIREVAADLNSDADGLAAAIVATTVTPPPA